MASPERTPPPTTWEKYSAATRYDGGRRWRRSCSPLSCFRSPVVDRDTEKLVAPGQKSPWFSWSRFRKKKKTVPVNASAAAAAELVSEKIEPADDQLVKATEAEEEDAKTRTQKLRRCRDPTTIPAAAAAELSGQTFFQKLHKAGKSRTGSKIQLSESFNVHVSGSHRRDQPRLPSLSTKYDTRRGPRVHCISEPARTGSSRLCSPKSVPAVAGPTTFSPTASPARMRPPHQAGASRLRTAKFHQKCEESLTVGALDPTVGLLVLALILAMMILFGRVSAIVCTCAWFYFLPRLRAAATPETARGRKDSVEIDFNSEEYKKKVILEGLLERNGRKPSGFL